MLKSFLYDLLRISNDINAAKKGKVGQRVGRRAAGKIFGRFMNRF